MASALENQEFYSLGAWIDAEENAGMRTVFRDSPLGFLRRRLCFRRLFVFNLKFFDTRLVSPPSGFLWV